MEEPTVHPWATLLHALEQYRLPLLSLASEPLSFYQDTAGVMHPTAGSLTCGLRGHLPERRMVLAEALHRCCAECLNATQALSVTLGRHMVDQMSSALRWLSVSEDLGDLLQLVLLARTVETLETTGPADESVGLQRAGAVLRQQLRASDEYFPTDLRDHPRVVELLGEATETLERWRARCPGETTRGVGVVQYVDLTSDDEDLALVGVVARRHHQPGARYELLVFPVSDAEGAVLERARRDGEEYGQLVRYFPAVPAERASVFEGLWESGLGDEDPDLPARVIAALDR